MLSILITHDDINSKPEIKLSKELQNMQHNISKLIDAENEYTIMEKDSQIIVEKSSIVLKLIPS